MENALVTYETAKLLKNKGFLEFDVYWYENTEETKHTEIRMGNFITIRNKIELCQIEYPGEEGLSDYIKFEEDANFNIITYQDGFYFAPTLSLAQKWLREIHNIHIQIIFLTLNNRYVFAIYKHGEDDIESVLEYETYELALEVALQEALKLI